MTYNQKYFVWRFGVAESLSFTKYCYFGKFDNTTSQMIIAGSLFVVLGD